MIVSQESRAEGQSSCGERVNAARTVSKGVLGPGMDVEPSRLDVLSILVAAVNQRCVDPCAGILKESESEE